MSMTLYTFASIKQCYTFFSTFASKENLDRKDGLNMEDQQVICRSKDEEGREEEEGESFMHTQHIDKDVVNFLI